jgi:DNA repair protein RadA
MKQHKGEINMLPTIGKIKKLYQKEERFCTGSENLDVLLGDGIETGAITQFYGPPGSVKTQLCYTICAMLPSQYKAVYIDTESTFRPERIESIAKARGLDQAKILHNIQVAKPLIPPNRSHI